MSERERETTIEGKEFISKETKFLYFSRSASVNMDCFAERGREREKWNRELYRCWNWPIPRVHSPKSIFIEISAIYANCISLAQKANRRTKWS